MSNYIPKYPDRGKSYIAFPTSYCVVDLETTGLSPDWDDIIEIGAIKFYMERKSTVFRPW